MQRSKKGEKSSQSVYGLCGLAVTLTFDLLTSKSTEFIFVTNFTEVVKWWNIQKRFKDTSSSL